jgi:HAD superfamily 5'-nucleotidase-like hydrolase
MPGVHVVRPLDMAAIEAVGFDLDHTLVLYDDAAVNALAYAETCESLAGTAFFCGPRARLEPSYDETQVCRGLLLDTAGGSVLKPDAAGRVRRARRRGGWLAGSDIEAAYPIPLELTRRFHPIHSPFDLPTAYFYQQLTVDNGYGEACTTIRRELDRVHTRGRFKRRVLERAESLVRPLASGIAPFETLRATGKQLFVLTNSDARYTVALLDRLFGALWRELFVHVVVAADKPAFFRRTGGPAASSDTTAVVEGASAGWLESSLGVAPERVLYTGDNVAADAIPARGRGWRTALVVPELTETVGGHWGQALFDDTHPTWLAATIAAHADVYAEELDDILGLARARRLRPASHPLASSGECP